VYQSKTNLLTVANNFLMTGANLLSVATQEQGATTVEHCCPVLIQKTTGWATAGPSVADCLTVRCVLLEFPPRHKQEVERAYIFQINTYLNIYLQLNFLIYSSIPELITYFYPARV
jgi:hypothetical protein